MPENKSKKSKWLIVLFIIGLLGALAWYQYYYNYVIVQDISNKQADTFPQSYGLSGGETSSSDISGTVYFTSPSAIYPVNELASLSHQYNLDTKSSDILAFQATRDFNPTKSMQSLVLALKGDISDSTSWQPHLFNRSTESLSELPNVGGHWVDDLKLSPDGKRYAYNYTAERDPSPNLRSLDDWFIAIHAMDSEEVITLEGAAEPEWLNEGADLLYHGPQGVFRYNLASGESVKVFDYYLPMDYFDGMAVSPDSKSVVITVPFISERTLVSVLQFVDGDSINGQLLETGRIVSSDTKRRSPVFSPDSQYYAVVAANETRSDGSENVPETEKVIEIRSLLNSNPVEIVTLEETEPSPVELEAWVNNSTN